MRQPKLRKKKIGKTTYWFTKAGGDTYLGNVTDVPYEVALRAFREHIANLVDAGEDRKRAGLTAGELMDLFLDWLKENRSIPTYKNRRTHCSGFGDFRLGGRAARVADLPANRIRGADLTEWLASLKKRGLSAQTRRHAETSIRHCWSWATKHPSPTPYLPLTYRPFSGVERTYVPPKTLTEDDLVTEKEVETLFQAALVDLDQFHRFGPKAQRATNPYSAFSDLLRCYYHTGARTGELAACQVGDVLFRTRQVILGKHKRSRTQREPTIRYITLNDDALEFFRRHSDGKESTESVFVNSDGRPWSGSMLAKRFERVKEVATALGIGRVRDEITIYSFRDLWISEALMAGNDIATVARMAGTSVAMIERVYGHFRNQHLHDAQARVDQLRQQRGR